VRVIAGSAKAVTLKVPPGKMIRPSLDKVKGAIFNVIGRRVEDARVLDLFAGTGALGIEALSRGARHCVFVDSSRVACRTIRTNLAKTKLAARARIVNASVAKYFKKRSGEEKFEIVFVDPPYAQRETATAANEIYENAEYFLNDKRILVFEHACIVPIPQHLGPLEVVTHKIHGDTAITFFT